MADLEFSIPIREHTEVLEAAIELDPEKRPTNDQLLVRSRSFACWCLHSFHNLFQLTVCLLAAMVPCAGLARIPSGR